MESGYAPALCFFGNFSDLLYVDYITMPKTKCPFSTIQFEKLFLTYSYETIIRFHGHTPVSSYRIASMQIVFVPIGKEFL